MTLDEVIKKAIDDKILAPEIYEDEYGTVYVGFIAGEYGNTP